MATSLDRFAALHVAHAAAPRGYSAATAIALPDIAAALQDADGSDTLTIAGVPDGATLSAGTDQGGGVWSLSRLSQAELNALAITPPAGLSSTFDLTVTAAAHRSSAFGGDGALQEADDMESPAQSFSVTVARPSGSAASFADASVMEDFGQAADPLAAEPSPASIAQPPARDARADLPAMTPAGAPPAAADTAVVRPETAAALRDHDVSKTPTLTISGLPSGATLSTSLRQVDQTAAVPGQAASPQSLTISLAGGANEWGTTITLSDVPLGVTFTFTSTPSNAAKPAITLTVTR